MSTPRRCSHCHSERGSSAIELVLVTPVLIALVFALIQTGLVWNARHTVGAAAQHGARVARTAPALQPVLASLGSRPEDEQRVRTSTLAYLRQIGGAGLDRPTVAVDYSGTSVTVTVTGYIIGALPGTKVRVSASSHTPLEGFRP
jgi:Flp pilus assembly protein TadG